MNISRFFRLCFSFLPVGFMLTGTMLQAEQAIRFIPIKIGQERTEACCVADFNRDGQPDIVAGEFIYLAPDWKPIKIREIATDVTEDGKGYAHDFANFPMDVDEDGFPDVVACDWFDCHAVWFRNPSQNIEESPLWEEHLIEKNGNFETLDFWDITGDGHETEIFPAVMQTVWYEKTAPGQFAVYVVSEKAMRFGNGVGDINGDGRPDLIRPDAWFEAPEDIRRGEWTEHSLGLLDDEQMQIRDTAQIHVYDLNGDGLNDLIFSAAHDYGLFWYEQIRSQEGEISWKKHVIDQSWSQVHTLMLSDIDGCGKPELVAGKRFMAHNGHDPGEFEPLGIYWYKPHKTNDGTINWEKQVVTSGEGIGAGMSLVLVDMNGDGRLDVVTTGKYGGPVLLLNQGF